MKTLGERYPCGINTTYLVSDRRGGGEARGMQRLNHEYSSKTMNIIGVLIAHQGDNTTYI